MARYPASDELSLRHLPDVSDTSFSIQIPVDDSPDSFLLAERSDFLHAADITFGCLAEATPSRNPLALNQPTPKPPAFNRPSNSHHITHPISSDPPPPSVNQASPILSNTWQPLVGKKLKQRQGADGDIGQPSSSRTFEKQQLMASFPSQDLTQNSVPDSGPEGSLISLPASKHKVHHAVNEKPRSQMSRLKPCRTELQSVKGKDESTERISFSEAITKPPLPTARDIATLREDADVTGDMSMFSTDAPIAERLLMYSKKYIELSNPAENGRYAVLDHLPGHDRHLPSSSGTNKDNDDTYDDRPLTVSQLSPRKETQSTTPDPAPLSPLRPSRKRGPVTRAGPSQSKRSKPSTVRRLSNSVLGRARKNTKPNTSNAKQDSHRLIKPKRVTSQKSESDISSNQLLQKAKKVSPTNSSHRSFRDSEKENVLTDTTQLHPTHDSTPHSATAGARWDKPPTASLPVNPTLRAGSGSQSRLGVRWNKSQNDAKAQRQRETRFHPVPDFKALHAMQEAELATRKGQIMPIIPAPVHFQTDIRAKEREKFDEMIREKEREKQAALEQRMRERAAEEEREIKELRKKAIPRAHEVPEWYKDAPKKKDGSIRERGS